MIFRFHPGGFFARDGSFCWFVGPDAIGIDGQAVADFPEERLGP